MFVKEWKYILIAAIAACCLSACTGKSTDSTVSGLGDGTQSAVKTKSIIIAESFNFSKGFYPVFTESTTENAGITQWGHNFYDNLVKYENGVITASLAKSWEMSPDGKEYTFHLREGVRFSDGSDFTAAAVKISFEQAIVNLGMYNGSFGRLSSLIESMETPDDHTFILRLIQPYYGTLNDLTMCTPLAIVNPKAFEGDPFKACTEATMGTGPYMYESSNAEKSYRFIRNPYYWGEKPEADEFIIKVIAENDSKLLALKSGEIDTVIGSSRISYDIYHEMTKDKRFTGKIDARGNLTDYIGMNISKPPFNDVNVRKAVAHAIDRELISEKIYYSINTPALTLLEKNKPFCNVETTTYEYNLEKARMLLDEAGWIDSNQDGVREKNGQKLEFLMPYTNAFGNKDDVAVTIASQLAKVGIAVKPDSRDMLSWFGPITEGNYAITLYKTYGGVFDPMSVLTNMNPKVATDPIVAQFDTFLPEGIIEELDRTADIKRVHAIYEEVLQTIAAEAAVAPIDTVREIGVWNSEKIADYTFPDDSLHIEIAGFHFR